MRATAYVPADAAYPARRRAERLSYAIWTIVGNQKVGVNAQGGSRRRRCWRWTRPPIAWMQPRRLREVKGQLGASNRSPAARETRRAGGDCKWLHACASRSLF